jgi:hypothetical protein
MCACALMPSLATAAARSIMRLNPGADSGAPRSETKTNGDLVLSLWWRRSSRNPRPVNGWVLGVPFLTRRTCKDAVLKSICSPQVDDLGRPQAMPIRQEHHQGVAVAVAVVADRLNHLLDFAIG